MRSPKTVRFRHHSAIVVAALIAAIGAIPLAATAWYLAPVILLPLTIAWWAWRSGTDADANGVRVRALLGQRRIAWSEVSELATTPAGRVSVRLADGHEVPLIAVTTADLPRLMAASGHHVESTPN
ncbi:MAG TPA: PH domain-containing protein [Micromonosporaceae bacterium]|nr:PH domain-containing protein [Micromonosporaceae bacterium]